MELVPVADGISQAIASREWRCAVQNQLNKIVIERFFEEVFNQQSQAAAAELIAPDFVAHHPAFPEGIRGPEGIMEMVGMFRAGFPDLHYEIDDLLMGEEDKVAVRWHAQGTHEGPFMQIAPTGKEVTVTGIDIFRVADDQCAEAWVNSDFFGLFQQLGAIPSA